MRFALAAVALFAVSGSASTVFRRQQFPDCATTCLDSADPGSCAETDYSCLCNDMAYLTSVMTCIHQDCTGADLTAAEQAGSQICLAVGVTLSAVLPGPSTTAASSLAASGSASVSAPAPSVTKPASSSVTAPVSSATTPATSSVSKPAATSVSGSGTTPPSSSSSGSASPASSSTSAGSIVGVSYIAGLAAFGLAALTL